MLKSTHLLASKRVLNWASRVGLSRRTNVLAVPTFFEPVSVPRLPTVTSTSEMVKNYLSRYVSVALKMAYAQPVAKAPIESALLLSARGPPPSASPGFIIRGRNRFSDFRTYLYRNVYPEFSSNEKKWIWRIVAANAFTFLLWQTWGSGTSGRQSMWENFMISIKSVRAGRLWVFFTSSVSSNDLITLMLNSTALLSFGTPILAALGTLPFLGLYLGASAFGACVHLESFAFPTQTETPTANQLWYSDHASFHSSTAAASALAGYYAGAWGPRPLLVAKAYSVPGFVIAGAFALLQAYHADNTRQPWQGNFGGFALGVAIGFVFRRRIRI